MAILVAKGIEKAFGERMILKGCKLKLDAHDRVGLVGVNGSGKSTLMAILGGKLAPDSGELHLNGSHAILDQDPRFTVDTVGEVVGQAVAWHRELLRGYDAALQAGDLTRSATLQDQLDLRGWEVEHKIASILDRVRAPAQTALVDRLSGGERRRVALAAALLQAPDLLMLDEPTNHLDADTIEWLQGYLVGYRGAVMLVTHDRYLLETVAERMVEIESGVAIPYEGSYGDYLIHRAERQAQRHLANDRTLNEIRREAAWAARSPSARSTKQKARLQRLDALKETVVHLADEGIDLDFRTGLKKGSTLLELQGICKSFGDRVLIDDLDLSLLGRERIGIVGPNGAGKTTLLRIIQGVLAPDAGEVLIGTRVKLGLLDQERTGLTDTDTVFEAAGDGNDQVKVGNEWIHVAGFLDRFSFPRQSFEQQVSGLSGGERARLLLAKLMLQGASLLLLDEPTNDLDLFTLRVLEEALLGFDGTAVIVTHDRAFLDRVCTAVLAFEGDGRITRYASRTQWLRAVEARQRQDAAPREKTAAVEKAKPPQKALSYKEQREFQGLPDRIDVLETQVAEIEAVLADPNTYRDRADEVGTINRALADASAEIETLYARWEALGDRA